MRNGINLKLSIKVVPNYNLRMLPNNERQRKEPILDMRDTHNGNGVYSIDDFIAKDS